MNDLAQWLSAQLDADERRERGRYLIHGSTRIKCPECPNTAHTITEHKREVTFDPCGHTMDGEDFTKTFATPDPGEFVLADIAAKRLILDEHPKGTVYAFIREGPYCPADDEVYPCRTVRLLALPYAGRDGYQERWRL
ncbi:DUF6221 family protein [Actinomadura madurae]|uniref:DUF6221 family protein n=1 Tax=Actinomadura madurae TaxID=1993 RepID=UPI0020D22B5C|nr:DUF6221 family protein [Actinomadura madurae]MCP9947242.1 DUF6221 family protein [Actinomadura madurae]MCP9964005.1 DUF6221 family protein [Actinomadura madurae]MCP9976481.1 DUF6221 family protein [Actinomadura madurae]MCQ0012026.1 DUF6221 family protein [Actinomadura madurae]MCQ0012673.1 DUF6221 family protein [Actinomadura madurae]